MCRVARLSQQGHRTKAGRQFAGEGITTILGSWIHKPTNIHTWLGPTTILGFGTVPEMRRLKNMAIAALLRLLQAAIVLALIL